MKVEFNTLYWGEVSKEQIQQHKKVTSKFNLHTNYHNITMPHGAWMDEVCSRSDSDVIAFFDSDCVPLNASKILEALQYVKKHDTFLGIAQVSNHIPPKSHIYAAPAFFAITKNCWRKLNTSFSETSRSDVGEELTYVAESLGKRYRCLYPTHFEREPREGIWPLGNYGYYGIGTVFDNTVYHLYQGRFGTNMELFMKRCDEILSESFTTENFINSRVYSYSGRAVP